MTNKKRYLVVDAGNTRVKLALFEAGKCIEFLAFGNSELQKVQSTLLLWKYDHSILASVRSNKDTLWLKQLMKNVVLFNKLKELLIKNAYQTPETLGVDRICNAIAAYQIAKSDALVIDIGTCLKFDFVTKDGTYLGGSISPGIKLRYKSLHEFTAGLPLLDEYGETKLIGTTTKESLHIGVIGGMKAEIQQFILEYQSNFPDLKIYLTGGDAKHFDFHFKNGIFAIENLTLYGLYNSIEAYAN